MSLEKGKVERESLPPLVEILMGAAHADGILDGVEAQTVRVLIKEMAGTGDLPEEIDTQIDKFDPEGFDPESACSKLEIKTHDDRRTLLKLVAEVTEADEIHDLDESAYIQRVAKIIGAELEEYQDLVVEIVSNTPSKRSPPPIPKR